jgi:hypothetical protein
LPRPRRDLRRSAQLFGQLTRRVAQIGDERLADLLAELRGYPGDGDGVVAATEIVLPLPLQPRIGDQKLSLFSVAASAETAGDITVAELVMESFYPADEATEQWLRSAAAD